MKGGDCGLFSSCMKRRASCSAQIVEPTFTPTMRDARVVTRQGRQRAESYWEPLPDSRFPDPHDRISAARSELSELGELSELYASVVPSKPAICGHLKTGHMNSTPTG